jgi:hypothetical protein
MVLSIRHAPKLGSRRPCPTCGDPDGLERVIVTPPELADVAIARQVHGYPYVDNTLANLDGCEKANCLGHPVIMSPSHEREVMRKNNLVKRQ